MGNTRQWLFNNNIRKTLADTASAYGEDIANRQFVADKVIDGDTIGNTRIAGIDSMESVGFDANNEKAQKILDEYGISFADQAKYGKQATEELRRRLLEGNYRLQEVGRDVYGRALITADGLNEDLLATGLYAPTDRYDKKSQDLFRKAQEKTARVNAKQAEMMEAQRQYNISGQDPGLLSIPGRAIDAFQSGAQQFVAGTGDFLLDVVTPGNNTWLDEAKSAEAADKEWGYDRREAQFQQDELMDDWKQGNYGSALGTAALLAPEVIGESLPMMASMITPTGLGRAAIAGVGAKALGATAKAAKAEGAIREANALSKFARSMTDDGFMLAVGTTTNNHIDEFTANNGGVGPSYGEIARMTAINALQLGTDKFAFQDIVGAGPLTGFVKAMKPMTKVVPDNVLGSIGVGVARTAMAMGEEAGQEYFQTWAEILNGQLGTTKYGSLENILANEQNQDEATLGALLGAGAGGVMRIPSETLQQFGEYTGRIKAKEQARYDALAEQILTGNVDESTYMPVRADGKRSMVGQIGGMVTDENQLPAKLAGLAMLESYGAEATEGSNMDLQTTVDNMIKSLRTTYKIGGDATVTDEAGFESALYQSAIATIKNVMQYNENKAETLKAAGLTPDPQATDRAIDALMSAYARNLPESTMSQINLSMVIDRINSDKKLAAMSALDKSSEIYAQLGVNAANGYKMSVDDMKATVSQLNKISMGSSALPGGGSKKPGSFSADDVQAYVNQVKGLYEEKIEEARANGNAKEVNLGPEFFDATKNSAEVGMEVMFLGKRDNATGKGYGKGMLEHFNDAMKAISKAAGADGNKTAVKQGAIDSWASFALNRLKAHSVAGLKEDGYFSRQEIWKSKGVDGKYGHNYIIEMDPSGDLARDKIAEAQYMINMAKQALKALEIAEGRISEKSYNDTKEKLEQIIAKSEADISELQGYIASKEKAGSGKIMVNLLNTLKHKKAKLQWAIDNGKGESTIDGIKSDIAETEARIAEAKSKNPGKFGENDPIYAFEDSVLGKSKRKSKPAKTSGSEEQAEPVVAQDEISEEEALSDEEFNALLQELRAEAALVEYDEQGTTEEPESETKAKVDENIDNKPEDGSIEPLQEEQIKDEADEQDETADGKSETSGEGAKSTEDPEDDQSGAEGNQEADAGTEGSARIVKDADLIAEADKETARLLEENIQLISEIADNAGVEFEYDSSEGSNLAINLRELRKAITAKVNSYKKSVKDEIGMHFTKADKLASLLTQAVKGEETGIRKIDKNDTIAEAASANTLKKAASVKGNEQLDRNNKIIKAIDKAKSDLEAETSLDKRASIRLKLRKLLGLLRDPDVRKPKRTKKTLAGEFDAENETYAEQDLDDEIAAAKEYYSGMQEAYDYSNSEAERMKAEDGVNNEPQAETEIEDEPEHEELLIDVDDELQSIESELAVVLESKMNIFGGADGITATAKKAQELKDAIAATKKEIQAQYDKMVEEEIQRLSRANGTVIGMSVDEAFRSQAKKNVKQEMENC